MSWLIRLAGVLLAGLGLFSSLLYVQALMGRDLVRSADVFRWTQQSTLCSLEEEAACASGNLASLAARSPLSASAYTPALAESLGNGDADRAARLAGTVFRRDPRNTHARLILAGQAMEQESWDEFLSLYLPAFRTDPGNTEAYADTLARLSRNPDLFEEVKNYLVLNKPAWGSAFAQRARLHVPLPALIGLYAEYPAVQPAFVRDLLASGSRHDAYAVFAELVATGVLGRDERTPGMSAPYNPGLLPVEAPPPFNWNLDSRDAEFLERGGVYVFYEGRRPERFLSQDFPVAPGRYTFAAHMSGNVSQEGGWFRWQFACPGSPDLIASFDVLQLSTASETLSFDFVMPRERCPFVTLALTGAPGMFPRPARLEITSVTLTAASPGLGQP